MYHINKGLWIYLVNDSGIGFEPWQYVILTAGFVLLAMAAGYLFGSVNSAIVISKLLYGEDIRSHGSGNAGLTNMLRTYGKKAAGLTLLGDFLKTALAVVFGCLLGGFEYFGGISLSGLYCEFPLGYIAGFFSVIGHIWPVYYKFKGGKGVLCTAVMALILTPVEFLILVAIFTLIVVLTKYVSLGSVTVAALYPVVVSGHVKVISAFTGGGIRQNGVMALITILLAILIVYCHKENLKRISSGTERKFSIGSDKPKGGNGEGGK